MWDTFDRGNPTESLTSHFDTILQKNSGENVLFWGNYAFVFS